VTFENSPSKVAEANQPLIHLISAEAAVSAESCACAAPLATKDAPGSVWKVAAMLRSGLKSCAETSAKSQDPVLHRPGLIGADAEIAAGVGEATRRSFAFMD
jgi:hypothetical protein